MERTDGRLVALSVNQAILAALDLSQDYGGDMDSRDFLAQLVGSLGEAFPDLQWEAIEGRFLRVV